MRLAAGLLSVLALLVLCGCETTQEKSAKLQRIAKIREAGEAKQAAVRRRLLTISHPSRDVSVADVTLLHSSEGLAAVVTLQNRSAHALREVPVRINVHDVHGRSIFTNEQPGQSPALISASFLPAHGRLTWIDDQIPILAGARSVTAEAGEASRAAGAPPSLAISGAHQIDDVSSGAGAEGLVANHSALAQRELVVYGVVRRGGKVVAAGRAVLPEAPAGQSTRFQLFFIGEPHGGRLEVLAPPSTLG